MTGRGHAPSLITRRLVASLSLLLFSFCISIYVAEGLLRAFFVFPTPLADHYPLGLGAAGSEIRVQQEEYDITLKYNLAGFRDAEIPQEKIDERRVLFLGDSFVEGFGVEVRQRFSDILIGFLSETGRLKYRAVNAGQLATNPISYYQNLVDFGMALQPDLIILGVFLGNDFLGARHTAIPQESHVQEVWPDTRKGALTLSGFLSVTYGRALVSQAMQNKTFLFARVHKNNFWEIYFKKPINKQFFLSTLDVSVEEFDRLTAFVNPALLWVFLSSRLNPGYLVDPLLMRASPTKEDSYYYSEADLEHTIEILEECQRIVLSRKVPLVVVIFPDIYELQPDAYTEYLLHDLGYPRIPDRLKQLPLYACEVGRASSL